MPPVVPRWAARWLIAAWTFALWLLACGSPAPDLSRFSVDARRSTFQRGAFPRRPSVELLQVFSIGRLEGPEEQMFGIVFDADLGPDGSVYVVDPQYRRVGAYDSAGGFRRWIGRTGQGPGEFMAPVQVVAFDSTIAVYDNQLGTISIFDTAGVFLRSFLVPVGFVEGVARSPFDRILVASALVDTAQVLYYDSRGTALDAFFEAPTIGRLVRKDLPPRAGRVCAIDSKILFANPWIYELALLDPMQRSYTWVKHWSSQVLRPVASDTMGRSVTEQGAAILGLECDSNYIVLAYFHLQTERLWFDFFDTSGNPLARLEFDRRREGPFPGAVAALRGDKLVTFRTRPYSQVFVYRVVRR